MDEKLEHEKRTLRNAIADLENLLERLKVNEKRGMDAKYTLEYAQKQLENIAFTIELFTEHF